MHSRRQQKDHLDLLIQRALAEKVAGEEPPTHVWNRIRVQLTRSVHRPPRRLMAPLFQAATLLVVIVFVITLVWEGTPIGQLQLMPFRSGPITPVASPSADTTETHAGNFGAVIMDAAEIELLREYSSLQSRMLIIEDLERREPGIAVPLGDIPPHPNSPQAKAHRLDASGDVAPAEMPAYVPGPIWQ